MKSTLPFIAQERSDACAVACLRMVLAHLGTVVSENEAIQAAKMGEGGLTPVELCLLAQNYGLSATEKQLNRLDLRNLVGSGRFPIVFLFRKPIDDVESTHAVIPIRFSRSHVTYSDPLTGQRRATVRKFEEARRLVARWVVVWEA